MFDDAQIDARIRQFRTSEVTLTLTGPDGRPLADTTATIGQVRHKFLLGCNLYMWDRVGDQQLQQAYRDQFTALFNYATLPFYWGLYERQPGQPDEQRLRAMAQWCHEQGIRAKGHPLVWHELPPRWLMDAPVERIGPLQFDRVRREVTAFRGLIDTWDVVNEAVVMPRQQDNPIGRLCRELGASGLIERSFQTARAAGPEGVLILNDFRHEEDFEQLVREALEGPHPPDAVGLQSHMHWGIMAPQSVWEVCERFARYGKPLHWTEVTLISGRAKTWSDHEPRDDWKTTDAGEVEQARHVRQFYRLLFSHPAVEAITWWDLSDRGAWQRAPAGLLREDMTPKPAYEALRQLIRQEWWTAPREMATDAAGQVRLRGFLGDYQVRGGGRSGGFSLENAGASVKTVVLE